jgi:hypothetical protein
VIRRCDKHVARQSNIDSRVCVTATIGVSQFERNTIWVAALDSSMHSNKLEDSLLLPSCSNKAHQLEAKAASLRALEFVRFADGDIPHMAFRNLISAQLAMSFKS